MPEQQRRADMSITRDDEPVQYDDRSYTQRLEDRIHELEVERTKEDDELAYKYELKINQLELERMWLKDLIANSWLSGDHKILLYTIRQIILDLRYDWTVPVMIYSAELQNKTGLGRGTIVRLTQELHDVGLITKETKGKGKEQRTWYCLGGSIHRSTKDIEIKAKPRNHGGMKCRKCGSKNIIVKSYQCLDCGHHENNL
jgi:hypothetical protein